MRLGWVLAVIIGGAVALWLGQMYTDILQSIP